MTGVDDLVRLVRETQPKTPRTTVWFSDERWKELVRYAALLDEQSARAANTRRWSSKHNLVGLVGEETYAILTGQSFSLDARVARGMSDGGEDFPGVDVKAVVHRPPYLKHPRDEPLKAAGYALVHVSVHAHTGRYAGYATRQMMLDAPVRDFGHGPCRTLEPDDLLPGFPG